MKGRKSSFKFSSPIWPKYFFRKEKRLNLKHIVELSMLFLELGYMLYMVIFIYGCFILHLIFMKETILISLKKVVIILIT